MKIKNNLFIMFWRDTLYKMDTHIQNIKNLYRICSNRAQTYNAIKKITPKYCIDYQEHLFILWN